MYYNISSMQDTSKLLQCTQAHAHRNEGFISKKSVALRFLPERSSPASSPAVRLQASRHRRRRCRVSPPCTVIVWISEATTGKGVSRQSSSGQLPEQAALQQTWTAWDFCFQEHGQITMTEFNIFLEAFISSTGA